MVHIRVRRTDCSLEKVAILQRYHANCWRNWFQHLERESHCKYLSLSLSFSFVMITINNLAKYLNRAERCCKPNRFRSVCATPNGRRQGRAFSSSPKRTAPSTSGICWIERTRQCSRSRSAFTSSHSSTVESFRPSSS
mgnify:CR=1 FL=1